MVLMFTVKHKACLVPLCTWKFQGSTLIGYLGPRALLRASLWPMRFRCLVGPVHRVGGRRGVRVTSPTRATREATPTPKGKGVGGGAALTVLFPERLGEDGGFSGVEGHYWLITKGTGDTVCTFLSHTHTSADSTW